MTKKELKERELSDEWYGKYLTEKAPSEEWNSQRYFNWKKRNELRNGKK